MLAYVPLYNLHPCQGLSIQFSNKQEGMCHVIKFVFGPGARSV